MTSAAATLPRDTTRLAFRWWQAGDEALAEELWGDGRVTALIDARPSLDRAAVAERLERELSNARAHGVQYWPIFLRSNGDPVGCCGLKPAEDGALELGFHLRPEHWGRGYATEAAQAVIERALQMGTPALYAGHHPRNAASRRTLEKLGFRRTGETIFPPTGLMHPWYSLVLTASAPDRSGGRDRGGPAPRGRS
jgi:RimJ/RimL family protein N-acetyltransferase